MIIVDTNKPKQNYRNLVEQQRVGNIIYQISDSHAQKMGNVCRRISIACIGKNKVNDYATIHGLDFSDGIIRSYYLTEDKKRSTHDGKYLEYPMGYYEEVIKALEVFKEIKNKCYGR